MSFDIRIVVFLTDPTERLSLQMVATHPWVVGDIGPIPKFVCWCKRNKLKGEQMRDGSITDAVTNTD